MVRVFVVYVVPAVMMAGGSALVRAQQLDPAISRNLVIGVVVAGLAWMFVAAARVK